MATKTLTVIRPGRYGTRMLKAGDTFDATAPEARLYAKLGWATEGQPTNKVLSGVDLYNGEPIKAPAKPKAGRKSAPKKKAPAKKKTA